MSHITVDGCNYVLSGYKYEAGVHVITVWTEHDRLVCDIEINEHVECGSVTYRDSEESHAIDYWGYIENVEKMGQNEANEELARWAVSVEE